MDSIEADPNRSSKRFDFYLSRFKVVRMKNLIGAIVVVVVWAYLPVLLLALMGPDDHVVKFLPVIPGWLVVWFFTPRDEYVQFRAAAVATPCVLILLAWFGSKGRLPRMAAGFLAFLNSFVCVAIYVVFSAIMAASGGAR